MPISRIRTMRPEGPQPKEPQRQGQSAGSVVSPQPTGLCSCEWFTQPRHRAGLYGAGNDEIPSQMSKTKRGVVKAFAPILMRQGRDPDLPASSADTAQWMRLPVYLRPSNLQRFLQETSSACVASKPEGPWAVRTTAQPCPHA